MPYYLAVAAVYGALAYFTNSILPSLVLHAGGNVLGAFDLLALTSESEGHPLVVLEAMARGLPVVATSVGGISGTVQHGMNGFIAPVRGVREIATALEILVNDPELRERMGRASLGISRSFSVDRMVDQTIALYEKVTSGADIANASDLKVAALR